MRTDTMKGKASKKNDTVDKSKSKILIRIKRNIAANKKLILLLPALWVAFILLITVSAALPKSVIEKNLEATTDYYHEKDNLTLFSEIDSSSGIHNYADAILFNIIASADSQDPLRSALSASYYESGDNIQGQNLYSAVVEKCTPNTSYERYWHGTLPVLRLLLIVTDIEGIRVFNIIVMTALLIAYFLLLFKMRYLTFAISSAVSFILCGIWIVPLCIEYFSCFFIFLLASIIILYKRYKEGTSSIIDIRTRCLEWLFIMSGALVCFLDFLTCEILTFCIPMLLLLVLYKPDFKTSLKETMRYGICWLLAYGLTWLCKWVLCCFILNRNLIDVALGQGALRIAGGTGVDLGSVPQFLAAVAVNLSLMFPFRLLNNIPAIFAVLFGLLMLVFCFWYLFRKKNMPGAAAVCIFIALIPFIRYAVVSNHSSLHPFFTYRDMIITIIGITASIAMSVNIRNKSKRNKGRITGKRPRRT